MNNTEIEHKYIVVDFKYVLKNAYKKDTIVQGYLSKNKLNTIRIRITNDIEAEYCVKSKKKNNTRKEYEHPLPLDSAKEQIETLTIGIVYKTRYFIKENNNTWEIDVYEGSNKGIVVAEIELNSESEEYKLPCFVGKNITKDKKYSNSNLSLNEPKIKNKYISNFKEIINN